MQLMIANGDGDAFGVAIGSDLWVKRLLLRTHVSSIRLRSRRPSDRLNRAHVNGFRNGEKYNSPNHDPVNRWITMQCKTMMVAKRERGKRARQMGSPNTWVKSEGRI